MLRWYIARSYRGGKGEGKWILYSCAMKDCSYLYAGSQQGDGGPSSRGDAGHALAGVLAAVAWWTQFGCAPVESVDDKAGNAWLHNPGVCWGWHFNPCFSSLSRLPATPHPLSILWSCEWEGGWVRWRAHAFCLACGATPRAPALRNTH